MDCTICAKETSHTAGFLTSAGGEMLSEADPKGGFRVVRGRSAGVRSTSGAAGHEIVFPTDSLRTRHVVGRLAVVPWQDERSRHAGAGGRGWSDPPLSMPGVPSRSSSSDTPMSSSAWRSLQSSNPFGKEVRDAQMICRSPPAALSPWTAPAPALVCIVGSGGWTGPLRGRDLVGERERCRILGGKWEQWHADPLPIRRCIILPQGGRRKTHSCKEQPP